MISYISSLPETAPPFPRRVAVMGSTGSIGVNALAVMDANKDCFTAVALAGGRNAALLAEQAVTWRPPYLAVLNEQVREEVRVRLTALCPTGYTPDIVVGPEGYASLAALADADLVLSAQVGAAGLAATYAAVAAGKIVALANKESLVLAGALLREEAARSGAVILPVDSEHNAIFQCLMGERLHDCSGKDVARLVLTASGGPFRGKTAAAVANASISEALAHPNWSMGAKITIDSATMMNKGLEIIEAHHLYGIPPDKIDVLVHPQSVIHSLVAFTDSSILAQAGPADMRIPVSYCLGWPKRLGNRVPPLDLTAIAALTFEKTDVSVFRCLALAREALEYGNGMPIVLNAANEVAVKAFLAGRIAFGGIPHLVERGMEQYAATQTSHCPTTLDDILALDRVSRQYAHEGLNG